MLNYKWVLYVFNNIINRIIYIILKFYISVVDYTFYHQILKSIFIIFNDIYQVL